MKEEKLKDLVKYINDNPNIFIQGKRESKKQHIVDQRTYLMFILISKFRCSPNDIATTFNIHRSLYYNVLHKITYLLKDKIFIDNVRHLIQKFPYTDDDVETVYSILRNKKEVIHRPSVLQSYEDVFKLSKKDIDKLKNNPKLISAIKQLIKTI